MNWPLYLGFRRNRDIRAYILFYRNLLPTAIWGSTNATEIADDTSATLMQLSQRAVSFAYGLQSIKDPNFQNEAFQKQLNQDRVYAQVPASEIGEYLLAASNNYVTAFAKKPAPQHRLFDDVPDIAVDGCWDFFYRTELFIATRDKKLKDFTDYFLQQAHFATRKLSEMKYQVVMNVTPCLQAVEDLKLLPDYADRVAADRAYLINQLLAQYDSPNRPICEGTGVLLASYDEKISDRCANGVRSVADAAWISSIFAGKDEKFVLP